MPRWLKGANSEKVLLSGVLQNRVFDDQELAFLIKLATKTTDDGKIENVKIGVGVGKIPARTVTCMHCTIPRTNFTAFYRRLGSTSILLIGVGEHKGTTNTKYKVDWADGSEVEINLKEKSTGADFLSDPKRLGDDGRPSTV